MKVNGKMGLSMAKEPIHTPTKISMSDGGNSVRKVEREPIHTMTIIPS